MCRCRHCPWWRGIGSVCWRNVEPTSAAFPVLHIVLREHGRVLVSMNGQANSRATERGRQSVNVSRAHGVSGAGCRTHQADVSRRTGSLRGSPPEQDEHRGCGRAEVLVRISSVLTGHDVCRALGPTAVEERERTATARRAVRRLERRGYRIERVPMPVT